MSKGRHKNAKSCNGDSSIRISRERYEKLIKLEGRVDALVSRCVHENYISGEQMLWAIGTDAAQEEARRRSEERKANNEYE